MSQNDAPGGVPAPVSLLTPAHWWPQVVNSTPEEMKACGDGRLKVPIWSLSLMLNLLFLFFTNWHWLHDSSSANHCPVRDL